MFVNIFPLLPRDSTTSQKIKLTLYKLLIRSALSYAAPVRRSTCSNSKSSKTIAYEWLEVIPGALLYHVYTFLILNPLKSSSTGSQPNNFSTRPSQRNHLIQQIGTYNLNDRNSMHSKHKRQKHILLYSPHYHNVL
jgi:hypothetical protein